MPDYKEIYTKYADQYELLISREDYQQNTYPALNQIMPLDSLDVVELGAGTGKLTSLLAPVVKTIYVFDSSWQMLNVASTKLGKSRLQNWHIAVADHRNLPIDSQKADLIISGWSIAYLVTWHKETWEDELNRAFAEMKRVLRPGGTVIILETLGTGHETPYVYDTIADYFAFLERMGFVSTWIRTDFRFTSLEEAEALANFFFGEYLARKVVSENWVILPECTGIWWMRI